jgi:hypothetical protein
VFREGVLLPSRRSFFVNVTAECDNSVMSISVEPGTRALRVLDVWRAKTVEEKRAARQSVVIDRVVASMAMENEPVSALWIHQAKNTKA